MNENLVFLTILFMALTTYMTRLLGYALLRDRKITPKTKMVLESIPGCVIISVIAPNFVSDRPADLLALGISILAAIKLPIVPTIIIAISATAILRHFLI